MHTPSARSQRPHKRCQQLPVNLQQSDSREQHCAPLNLSSLNKPVHMQKGEISTRVAMCIACILKGRLTQHRRQQSAESRKALTRIRLVQYYQGKCFNLQQFTETLAIATTHNTTPHGLVGAEHYCGVVQLPSNEPHLATVLGLDRTAAYTRPGFRLMGAAEGFRALRR